MSYVFTLIVRGELVKRVSLCIVSCLQGCVQLATAGGFALGPAIGGGLQQVHTMNVEVVVPVQYMKIFCVPLHKMCL